ncbi:MAG: pseudoazurin [Porticoccaceae bacterium]|nr:pseudoazurin [Porticoccaceae bacterium]
MSRFNLIAATLVFIAMLSGCGVDQSDRGLTSSQEQQVADRIAPVGNVSMAGDIAAPAVVSMASVEKVMLSEGSEHTVKMLNMGDGGSMIFEPAVIKVSKGDTIHFKAVDLSHNSATIDGMIPAGAADWAGALSQDISVTLDTEGVYVYQCDPHAMMAMVGVIHVGEAINMSEIQAAAEKQASRFMMNTDRLTGYLAQL